MILSVIWDDHQFPQDRPASQGYKRKPMQKQTLQHVATTVPATNDDIAGVHLMLKELRLLGYTARFA